MTCPVLHILQWPISVPSGWVEQTTEDCIRFCKLENLPVGTTNSPVVVLFCLVVHTDASWSVFTRNNRLTPDTCNLLHGTPDILSPPDLATLVAVLDTCTTCKGNPDEEFCRLATSQKGHFKKTRGGAIVAVLDTSPFLNSGCRIITTIRRSDCEILVSEGVCGPCKRYRPTLRSLLSKSKVKKRTDRKTTASSRVNWRYLTTPERKARVKGRTTQVRICANLSCTYKVMGIAGFSFTKLKCFLLNASVALWRKRGLKPAPLGSHQVSDLNS